MKKVNLKNLRPFFVPVGVIFVLFVMSYMSFNFFISNISELREKIDEANRQKNVLEERLLILRQNQVDIEGFENVLTNALPNSGATLLVLNQILNLQSKYLVDISDLRILDISAFADEENSEEVKRVMVEFSLIGDYQRISNYVADLVRTSPIISIEELELEGARTGLRANMRVSSFYSPYPVTLPSITEPIEDLTDSQKSIIKALEGFTQPTLRERENVAVPRAKDNPFAI